VRASDRAVRIIQAAEMEAAGADGQTTRVVGINLDITERKQAANALLETKSFLQSTLDALSAHIAILDEHGTIIKVNAAWNGFASENHFLGSHCGVGENYLKVCDSVFGSYSEEGPAVASGIRAIMAGQRAEFHLEYPCHSPQAQRWFMMRATRFGGDGPVRIVVAHEDITARIQAAELLAANETLLRQFIQHTPAAIAILDTQPRYIQASERWMQDYHLAGRDIIGKSHYEIFPDVPQRWKDIHQRVLAGAVERCDEDPFPRADGSTDWLQWETRPLRKAAGEIGGLIFFTQVITERKQREAEREKLISELQVALAEVKTLSGMITICGWCKNVRNDTGYWSTVEQYVRSHSDATFSHGMCPDCAEKFTKTTFCRPIPPSSRFFARSNSLQQLCHEPGAGVSVWIAGA
jgi:PAS domain S-box-containing protein